MSTYLFVWNPKNWAWDDLESQIEQIGLTGFADDQWSCGKRKQLPTGSRFFLIRLGVEPKGIMGSGFTLSTPEVDDHWDDAEAARGVEALYCKIRFDHLAPGVVIPWNELQEPPLASFHWSTQASGIQIPDSIADSLEERWQLGISGTSGSITPALVGTFPEGATRTVIVNAYERNPVARKACIAHHGHRCKICGIDLSERYRKVADGFIHVHHIMPLSQIRTRYQVNPITDLIPVCPNCHAVIHLKTPPYTVEEAKAFLRTSS